MKRRMIGAWLALMITASSLVVSASPAADMSSVSADPQQEQTEPEEEEEAPDIPVTDQPGEAEMPVPTALPEPETVEEAFEEGKDNTENTDSDELIEPEEEPEAASKEGENIALRYQSRQRIRDLLYSRKKTRKSLQEKVKRIRN